MRAALWVIVGILFAFAVESRAQQSIVGQWLVRDAQMEVRAEFRADGTFVRVNRSAAGVETVQGSYRVTGGVVELQPQGASETIKLNWKVTNNTLELKGDDGAGVQMIRQEAAVPADQKNPLDDGAKGNPLDSGDQKNPLDQQNPPKKGAAKTSGAAVTYSVYHYIDQGGLRDRQSGQWLEGFSILVPKGWKFTGGFRWVASEKPANQITKTDLLNPVKSDYAITSPDGLCVVRQYPVEYWCAIDMFAPGHNYNGMIVCPALTPEQYITQFVIPRQRGGQLTNLQVIKQEPLEDLSAKYAEESRQFDALSGGAAQGNALSFKAGGVTIEYVENNIAYRERFICIQQYLQTANMIMWWPRSNYSVRAPRDQFDAMTQTFTTIATSVQTNPRWSIALIELRQGIQISIAKADEYCNRVRREIAQAHAQTTHELARDSGYLSGDYYPYKGTDGNRYTLPTDKYHFMNKDGDILSQDDFQPPSSDWTSIEPYNQ